MLRSVGFQDEIALAQAVPLPEYVSEIVAVILPLDHLAPVSTYALAGAANSKGEMMTAIKRPPTFAREPSRVCTAPSEWEEVVQQDATYV